MSLIDKVLLSLFTLPCVTAAIVSVHLKLQCLLLWKSISYSPILKKICKICSSDVSFVFSHWAISLLPASFYRSVSGSSVCQCSPGASFWLQPSSLSYLFSVFLLFHLIFSFPENWNRFIFFPVNEMENEIPDSVVSCFSDLGIECYDFLS